MEGRGVTNYSTEKPAYAFSTRTTEFDDALVERNIVTLEQAFMAKGASAEDAQRLAALKRAEDNPDDDNEEFVVTENKSGADSEDDESDESDDEFLEHYRRQRLEELKKSKGPYGEVIPISRPDWTREVNDDSHKAWVVVTLTSQDVERTGCVEAAANNLAPKFPSVKFVTIPSTSAIANWPNENLPTVFLYRKGSLQKEFIRLDPTITPNQLEWNLAECGVLETELEEPPTSAHRFTTHTQSHRYGCGSSIFGGSLTQLETRRNESDEDEDSDGT